MFEEALGVVERMALMAPNKVEEIRVLSQKCRNAAVKGAREEEVRIIFSLFINLFLDSW